MSEVKEKGSKARYVKEQVELYSDRVSDLVKSIASVEKMEQDSMTAIETLEYLHVHHGWYHAFIIFRLTKEELAESIRVERTELEFWQEALKSITEFSKETDLKFSTYLTVSQYQG